MASGNTWGDFNYLGPMDEAPLLTYVEGSAEGNLHYDNRAMPLHDLRAAAGRPTLDREGLTLIDLAVDIAPSADAETIALSYSAPLEALMREVTGAEHVVLSPPLLRWSENVTHARRQAANAIPALYVHCDYNRESFHALMARMVENDTQRDRWLSGRYVAYNTWRVLTPPPQDYPLAVLDRTSLSLDDLMPGTVRIDGAVFTHTMVRYNPDHQWWFVPDMTVSDTLVFVGYDSAADDRPGPPHSAFHNTAAGGDAVPRVSCEVRAFAYWGRDR